jgi:hypothetical protein
MDPRTLSTVQAAGRIVLGSGLLAAPSLMASGWVGDDGSREGAQLLAMGLGARDIAIGVGQLAATRAGHGVRPWALASVLSDGADFAATMKYRDRIPATAVAAVGALALGSAILAAYLSTELD